MVTLSSGGQCREVRVKILLVFCRDRRRSTGVGQGGSAPAAEAGACAVRPCACRSYSRNAYNERSDGEARDNLATKSD